jgi:succinyl-diaminopimelate desuccinylase
VGLESASGLAAATLALAEALIARPSVTPDDGGCIAMLAQGLQAAGFDVQTFRDGPEPVHNLLATLDGNTPGLRLGLAGHVDVVPPGPLEAWHSDPFTPQHEGGMLRGRGAADMKAAVAAMAVAAQAFAAQNGRRFAGQLRLLFTSDEEGPATHGTVSLVQRLHTLGQGLDACLVGEPTSVQRLGDVAKNGRRGTLGGHLRVLGRQGHIAYPQLALNPTHALAPALAELCATVWDEGHPGFPPTGFQISNVQAGTGALNVIPGELHLDFNFRFCPASTAAGLKAKVEALLHRHQVPHELRWTLGGEPFHSPAGRLSEALSQATLKHCGLRPELSTTGGTSDGRFIARICPEVLEFGHVNASIHQVNEQVASADVGLLAQIYFDTIATLLAPQASSEAGAP